MRVKYTKKEKESPEPQPQPTQETDWVKLGYADKPEPKEEFQPGRPDVPGLLPDQSPKQISPLHDKIHVDGESTFIHQKIKAREEARDWVLSMLGYPLVTAELTEEHINTAFTNAFQLYTEYAYFPDKYLLEYTNNYIHGVGMDLSKYNVSGVSELSVGLNSLMFYDWPFLMNRAGYQGSGTLTGSFVTYHNMVEFREMVTRLCAREFDFNYSKYNKLLTLIPEPPGMEIKEPERPIPMVITVQVEPPVWDLYGDMMVRRIALAYCKIILGQIRGKFEGVNLPGGGSISKEIGAEGKEELEKLEEKIRTDRSRGQNWYFA